MRHQPLVSVVLPTHNRAQTLARAMRSVLNQTYRNLELIVIDDGSTDDSAGIVRGFGDSRVRYIRQDNAGAAAARNTGIRVARGELVAFQDSDDEWLDGKVERQVAEMASEGVVLCVCSYLQWSIHEEPGSAFFIGTRNLVHPGDLKRQTLENFFFPTPTWLVRRSALERTGGFDPALPCWEDWELAIRLSDAGEFAGIDDPLHLQHFSRRGVNSAQTARMISMRRMIERHGHRWARMPRTLAEHYYTIGRLEALHGPGSLARGNFWRAVRLNKLHRKAWIGLLLAWCPEPLRLQLVAFNRWRHGRHLPPLAGRLGPRHLN